MLFLNDFVMHACHEWKMRRNGKVLVTLQNCGTIVHRSEPHIKGEWNALIPMLDTTL